MILRIRAILSTTRDGVNASGDAKYFVASELAIHGFMLMNSFVGDMNDIAKMLARTAQDASRKEAAGGELSG